MSWWDATYIHEVCLKKEASSSIFKADRVKYIGSFVMDQGIILDPQKMEPILNMLTPEDKPALQVFLCVVKYLVQFMPN